MKIRSHQPLNPLSSTTKRALCSSLALSLLLTSACDSEESLAEPVQEPAANIERQAQDPFAPSLLSNEIQPPSVDPDFSPDEGWVYLGKSAPKPGLGPDSRGPVDPNSVTGNPLFDEILDRAQDFEKKGAFEKADQRTSANWDGGYQIAMTSEGHIYATHSYEGLRSSIEDLPGSPSDELDESGDRSEDDAYRRDNRKRMRNIRKSKWRPIGAMVYKGKNGRYVGCTGTQVGPRVVITAAHCIYDGSLPRYFDAGRDGSKRYLRSKVSSGRFWIHPKYKSWRKIGKYDIAMLVLKDSSKLDDVGYWGVSTSGRRQLKGETVRSCGYPGTDPKGRKGTAKPWCSKGQVKRVWGKRFRSSTYLTPGQSGSAVWLDDEPRTVRGIHAGDGLFKEWHARITGDVIDVLCDLRRKYTSKAYGKKDPSC